MGDHYLLNGTKNWITNGGSASIYLVMARPTPTRATAASMPRRGARHGRLHRRRQGQDGHPQRDTHTLMFQDVKVPKANRLGEDGLASPP